MNDLLKKDITIRSLSILFAVILWFFVLSEVNPLSTVSISVPLSFINESSLADKGLGIKDRTYQRDIIVTVEGRRNSIRNVSANDFQAYVDFSLVKDATTNEIPVDLQKVDESVKIRSISNNFIKVQLENIDEKLFKIDVRIEGNLKNNYVVVEKTAMPDFISISGLQSFISSISSVIVQADANELDRDLVVRKDCKVLNANGEEIMEYSGKYGVNVKVSVAKEVPVVPVINGSVAADYTEKSRTVTPQKVLIKGAPDVLNQIDQLYTEPVELGSISSNVSATATIVQPLGTSLYNSSTEAQIGIEVEKLAVSEFKIDRSSINIVSNEDSSQVTHKFEILTPSMNVRVKGLKSDVDKVQGNKLFPTIYMENITEGTNKVLLSISLPNGVKLAEEYFVDVKVTKVDKQDGNSGQVTQDGSQNAPPEPTPTADTSQGQQ